MPIQKKSGNLSYAPRKILNKTVCILHSANILGKGMNPIILPLAMGK